MAMGALIHIGYELVIKWIKFFGIGIIGIEYPE
jgi:hypothetical protein